MKKHLVIVGFDDIIADKYMETIEQAISNGHISGYSIIDWPGPRISYTNLV